MSRYGSAGSSQFSDDYEQWNQEATGGPAQLMDDEYWHYNPNLQKNKNGLSIQPIIACFQWIHNAGITPCAYSRGDHHEKQRHYKATMFWTTLITFITATAIYANNTGHIQDKEHSIFNRLDHFGHQAFAAIALAGFSVIIGAVASGIHYGVNYFRKTKDREDYSIQLQIQNSRAEEEEDPRDVHEVLNETSGLMGEDKKGASFFRLEACHPLNLIYPATPLKTMAWISVLALSVFVIGSLINPKLFNEIAGDSPLANGTFTNCTPADVGGNDTLANITNPACVEEIGHIGAVATLGALSALAVGGAVTLFHYAGAKIADSGVCKRHRAQVEEINDNPFYYDSFQ